jgi:hypothetical protein
LALTKSEREYYRRTAATCFNRAWDYLEMKHRDSKDEEEMLNLAHASRYHWGVIGSPRQRAVGDWQLARVYAAIGDAELSLQFALSSLRTCEQKHLKDIVPSAMEGVARAYAIAGDGVNAKRILGMAREKLAKLDLGAEDRKVFLSQMSDTERLIRRSGARA